MAFALARLAAIAAATEGFFLLGAGVSGGGMTLAAGFGFALSSCFLAVASKASAMASAAIGHTP